MFQDFLGMIITTVTIRERVFCGWNTYCNSDSESVYSGYFFGIISDVTQIFFRRKTVIDLLFFFLIFFLVNGGFLIYIASKQNLLIKNIELELDKMDLRIVQSNRRIGMLRRSIDTLKEKIKKDR